MPRARDKRGSRGVAPFATVPRMAESRAHAASVEPADDATAFVLRLGRALHAEGYPSHRIEEVLGLAADKLGLAGQFFTTPTSIFAAFGELDRQRTFLVRVEPGDLDLARLARVQQIAQDVLSGRLAPHAGLAGLDQVEREP